VRCHRRHLSALEECREIDEIDRRFSNCSTSGPRRGRDRPHQARGQAADLRAEARGSGFRNVTSHNGGPLTDPTAVKRIFERIIDEMRKVQKDRMERRVGTPHKCSS
jgi:hypothetical protein